MKLISIDVGVKNLAFCVIDTETRLEQWKCLCLCETNANKISMIDLGKQLMLALNQENLENIDMVLIEEQLGPMAVRMKCLEGMIIQYFLNHGISNIKMISSRNKLKGIGIETKGLTYNERKKAGVAYVKTLIGNGSWDVFFNKHKKKDDLADCLLQALYYINCEGLLKIKTVIFL